jgi:UrcA family protein
MFRSLAAGAVIAAGLSSTSLAAAPSGSDDIVTAHRTVKTDGLDLTTQAGQAELYHRIVQASRLVCAELYNGTDFANAEFRDCTREAYARAWPKALTRIALAGRATSLASAAPK